MRLSIAHLGPSGTYAEAAALAYANWLVQETGKESFLCPYPSIAQTLAATADGQADIAVVPVENSVEGGVTMTLDTLWCLDQLQIQQALVLPISHALISCAKNSEAIKTVYSHPQALAQCQKWLEKFLPTAQIVAMNSTTEALEYIQQDATIAAIASERAAQLYNLPILICPINDYIDNHTRFWVLSLKPSPGGNQTSVAFSLPANVPGALMKPLEIFASRNINLSRIESRPTKRSLGEYVFFMDLEADANQLLVKTALAELKIYTEKLKILGSYTVLNIEPSHQEMFIN